MPTYSAKTNQLRMLQTDRVAIQTALNALRMAAALGDDDAKAALGAFDKWAAKYPVEQK